jgi:DMSO/TMAO reductase YedYZ molybdopterin-dependent catalytic subunit
MDHKRSDLTILEKLPVHALEGRKTLQPYVLCVDGLVRRCLHLTVADLEKLPQQDVSHDFTCLEGWTVPDVKWSGVLLEAILLLTEPSPEARYVQASAGEFSISLPRDVALHALLAIRLVNSALALEHGGPVRLIVPGGECFMNIKWLDHLKLRRDAGSNTGETIALGRAADHQVIGIVNDVRFQTFLVPQLLPTEHEPTHVQITQQWAESFLW